MNKLILVIVLTFLFVESLSLYTAGSPVTQLTAKEFDKVYKGVWLV